MNSKSFAHCDHYTPSPSERAVNTVQTFGTVKRMRLLCALPACLIALLSSAHPAACGWMVCACTRCLVRCGVFPSQAFPSITWDVLFSLPSVFSTFNLPQREPEDSFTRRSFDLHLAQGIVRVCKVAHAAKRHESIHESRNIKVTAGPIKKMRTNLCDKEVLVRGHVNTKDV